MTVTAGRENPTNEHVVALLQQILREMKDLGVRQKRIEANLAKRRSRRLAEADRTSPVVVVEGLRLDLAAGDGMRED